MCPTSGGGARPPRPPLATLTCNPCWTRSGAAATKETYWRASCRCVRDGCDGRGCDKDVRFAAAAGWHPLLCWLARFRERQCRYFVSFGCRLSLYRRKQRWRSSDVLEERCLPTKTKDGLSSLYRTQEVWHFRTVNVSRTKAFGRASRPYERSNASSSAICCAAARV